MRTIGLLATALVVAAVVAAVVTGVRSREDLERYLKMRKM